MRFPHLLLLWCTLALAGCTCDQGTPCDYDYQCSSNSCTLGSCDGFLGAAIQEQQREEQEEALWTDTQSQEDPEVCDEPLVCRLDCAKRWERGLGCSPEQLECEWDAGCPKPCKWIDPCKRPDLVW